MKNRPVFLAPLFGMVILLCLGIPSLVYTIHSPNLSDWLKISVSIILAIAAIVCITSFVILLKKSKNDKK